MIWEQRKEINHILYDIINDTKLILYTTWLSYYKLLFSDQPPEKFFCSFHWQIVAIECQRSKGNWFLRLAAKITSLAITSTIREYWTQEKEKIGEEDVRCVIWLIQFGPKHLAKHLIECIWFTAFGLRHCYIFSEV